MNDPYTTEEIINEKETIRLWVACEFGNIPTRVIERAYGGYREELVLVAGGDRLCDSCQGRMDRFEPCGECEECKAGITCRDTPMTTIAQESDDYEAESAEFICEACDRATIAEWTWSGSQAWPASWGTMFRPPDHGIGEWITQNADAIADLNFLIYTEPDIGVLLGIDAGGTDFYEAFWIPLWRLWKER